jgi:hypothetical protein
MILCESVRLGAPVELHPRDSVVRTLPGRVLYEEFGGILHVYDGGKHFAIWPPPGTVAVLGESLPPGVAEAAADAAQFPRTNEPQRSPASDSPPPARPIKPRR